MGGGGSENRLSPKNRSSELVDIIFMLKLLLFTMAGEGCSGYISLNGLRS